MVNIHYKKKSNSLKVTETLCHNLGNKLTTNGITESRSLVKISHKLMRQSNKAQSLLSAPLVILCGEDPIATNNWLLFQTSRYRFSR